MNFNAIFNCIFIDIFIDMSKRQRQDSNLRGQSPMA